MHERGDPRGPPTRNRYCARSHGAHSAHGSVRNLFFFFFKQKTAYEMMRPVFEAWLAPFKDMGATTVTIRDTGSTDHVSFDAVGLPGFQFIQDSVEYGTRTHHSNMDVFDPLQPGDLVQASSILAPLVYPA